LVQQNNSKLKFSEFVDNNAAKQKGFNKINSSKTKKYNYKEL